VRPIAIFDFDGTLADSLDVVIDEYNRLAPRFRVKPVDRRELPRLRTLKGPTALREHNVSFWKLPFLVHTMRRALHERVTDLKPFVGIPDALQALAQAGCSCSVLSTNSTANIQHFLGAHKLSMFEHVAGGASMFGKAAALKKLIQRAKLDRARVHYIGDEIRDVAAAKAAGVRSIAVSWGYAQREALAALNPDHIVDTPAQLVQLLS
jgi:phosphoglycolate phosphatase-like HAD superfamily hydrolase